MDRADLLETLRSLVEGKLEATEWVQWWPKNGKAAEKLLGSGSAERLRPNYKDSDAGAAHNSQQEAMAILKKAGIKAKRSTRYHAEFLVFLKNYMKTENAREMEKGEQLKPRINLLKPKYPTLYACLYRNNKKIETFEPGASEADIAKIEKTLKAQLPKAIREFFKITKQFRVEGMELDLDLLFEHPGDKSAPDGKRYICLGNYFRDDDGDQILIEVSKPSADAKILYYAHSAKSPKVQPLADSWKEFLEKLPKQYLNQMFYYS